MKNKLDYESFDALYKKAKQDFPTIVELSTDRIQKIQIQIEEKLIPSKTKRYLFAISFATILVTWGLFYLFRVDYASDTIILYLKENLDKIQPSKVYEATILLFAFGAALITYVFIMPLTFRIKAIPMMSTFSNVKRKESPFINFSIIAAYLIVGAILSLFYLHFPKLTVVVLSICKIYIVIPLFFLGAFLFFTLLSLLIRKLNKPTLLKVAENKRAFICIIILNLLKTFKQYESCYILSDEDSRFIIRNFYRVSQSIKNYSSGILNTLGIVEPVLELDKAANGFNELIIDFLATPTSHVNKIEEKLIEYLNIFLSGSLLDLPKSDLVIEIPREPKKLKFYHYMYLVSFLAIPIVVVIVITSFFNVKITDYNQTLLKIIYLIWVVIGVIYSPIISNTENKEFVKDILKSILGKG
jgi:hypothetical protein